MFESNDSSDENDESLVKQVLPIVDDRNEPIDMNKIPMTGEEYLKQVRFQASQLPDFQTARRGDKHAIASMNMKKHAWHKLFSSSQSSTITKHTVSIDWQNEQCQTFSNTRNDFFPMRDRLRTNEKNYQVPKLRNAMHYWKFCFGNDIPFQSSLEIKEQEQTQHLLPTMKKMMTLTQPQLHELLQHEIEWLKQSGCSIHLALYTFATLVAIEKPISEDVMYTMRQTCLSWKEIRTKLLAPTDPDHSIDDSLIKSSDLFVCIIGRYFGQFDLADSSD